MDRFEFKPVELLDRNNIYKYMSEFGEGSCQHSFVSMLSLSEKYKDSFCIADDMLYTLRKNLCDEEFRVYLAPMGHGDKRRAFENILKDAHSYQKKAKFITLTKQYADFLDSEFSGQFDIKEDRDLAEYIFYTEKMSTLAGRALKKRRIEANHFWNVYGDRASVKRITKLDLDDIWNFEKKWVELNKDTHDRNSLELESRVINFQLKHFDELDLSGIVVRIDGIIKGFGYGTKLSNDYYDAIAEKGDRNIPGIYKILRMESVKQCAMECKYVNMEEDLGIMGLREIKNNYMPAFLIRKFVVTER